MHAEGFSCANMVLEGRGRRRALPPVGVSISQRRTKDNHRGLPGGQAKP
jgi:hypothetical protein